MRQRFKIAQGDIKRVPGHGESMVSSCDNFQVSPPLLLSQCHQSSNHMLMVGCCDEFGQTGRTQLIPVSNEETIEEHIGLNGVSSQVSLAPLHEITYSVRRSADNIRTTIVSLMPRYVVVNILSCSIFVRQNESPTVLVIPPGGREYLWWWAESKDRAISILPDEGNDNWSTPFTIQGAETFLLQVRDRQNKLRIFQGCVSEGASTVLTVCDEPCPPVRIDNQTSYSIAIGEPKGPAEGKTPRGGRRHKSASPQVEFMDTVPPLGTLDFCFARKKNHEIGVALLDLSSNLRSTVMTVDLSHSFVSKTDWVDLGGKPAGYAGSLSIMDMEGDVVAYLDLKTLRVGPQIVLQVQQRMADAPPPKPGPPSAVKQVFELEIMLVGAGISLVDTTRHVEVMHLCISGARYWATKWSPVLDESGEPLPAPEVRREVLAALGIGDHASRGNMAYQLTVDGVQADAQRTESAFPLVISRVEHSLKPTVHFSVRRTLGQYGGGDRIHYYQHVNLILQPMHIMVESGLLNIFLGADSPWACVSAPYIDPKKELQAAGACRRPEQHACSSSSVR